MPKAAIHDPNPHREHPFLAELESDRRPPEAKTHHVALLILGAFAVSFIVTLPLTWGHPVAKTSPVHKPDHETAVPAVEPTRDMVDRLRDFRAGYEAAVQNGCSMQPALGSPIRPQS